MSDLVISSTYLRDLLLYRLTLRTAEKDRDESTVPDARSYDGSECLPRYIDQTNCRKSVDQILALLQVLNCDVSCGRGRLADTRLWLAGVRLDVRRAGADRVLTDLRAAMDAMRVQ